MLKTNNISIIRHQHLQPDMISMTETWTKEDLNQKEWVYLPNAIALLYVIRLSQKKYGEYEVYKKQVIQLGASFRMEILVSD